MPGETVLAAGPEVVEGRSGVLRARVPVRRHLLRVPSSGGGRSSESVLPQ